MSSQLWTDTFGRWGGKLAFSPGLHAGHHRFKRDWFYSLPQFPKCLILTSHSPPCWVKDHSPFSWETRAIFSLLTPLPAPAGNPGRLPDQVTQWRQSRVTALYSHLPWRLHFNFKLHCWKSVVLTCICENLPVFSNCKPQCRADCLCLQPLLHLDSLIIMVITTLTLKTREIRSPSNTVTDKHILADPFIVT